MTARALALALAVASSLSGCASRRRSADEPPRPDASGWVSTRFRDHPLVGKIWSPRRGTFVDQAELDAAVAGAHYLLLGETHDNADHHLAQARLVRAAALTGRKPSLAFEMIDTTQQPALDAALAARPAGSAPDARALAGAVGWAKSGWPAFGMYRPVFEAGLAANLPIVAANLPRSEARKLFKEGPASLPAPVRARLDRVGKFPDDVMKALRTEMFESHCSELPDSMVEPMVLAQKAKDAQLAERMVSSDRGDGAILIAGRGHARNDVAVPAFLASDAAKKKVLAVGLSEVSGELQTPEEYGVEYGAGPLPFDYVVFTPAAVREDPCEGFRAQQAKKRGQAAAKPTEASGGAAAPPR